MKKAIIIKGNPKFIKNNSEADNFYEQIKKFLEELSYDVSFDDGEDYTTPLEADLWLGHSRGSSRLRFASKETQTIAIGIQDGINHPKDKSLSKGQIPDKYHYILTEEMKEKIIQKINKK